MSHPQPAAPPVRGHRTITASSTSPLVDTPRHIHAQIASDGVASAETPRVEAQAHGDPMDDNSRWTTDNGYSTNAEQADNERTRPGYHCTNDKKKKKKPTRKAGQPPKNSYAEIAGRGFQGLYSSMPYANSGVARRIPPVIVTSGDVSAPSVIYDDHVNHRARSMTGGSFMSSYGDADNH